jgi:hypothetical protein
MSGLKIPSKNTLSPGGIVALGQLCLFFFIAVSVALHPGFVLRANEGGVSNYGIHLKTALPYTLAFGLCALCSLAAARRYPGQPRSTRDLRALLIAYACLSLLTLASTYVYKLSHGLHTTHEVVGVATVSFEVLASLWLCAKHPGPWALGFLVVQLTGSALAGITFLGLLHVLFLGQVLAELGFALLLVRGCLATDRSLRASDLQRGRWDLNTRGAGAPRTS